MAPEGAKIAPKCTYPFATVYPAIYCRKQFDVNNYITFRWRSNLTKLQQKCIRMGITIFKMFIWGGILSDIRLELARRRKTKFPTVYATIGAEVTGQLRVNGKLRPLRCCPLEDQLFALKRKHKVHKYVNIAVVCMAIVNLSILNMCDRSL